MNHATRQVGAPVATFTQLLSSTRRGARLARLLAVTELRSRGASHDLTERAELVVAELAANAVLHGRVASRCFRLTLVLDLAAGRLRIEVSDARGDLRPLPRPTDTAPDPLPTGGRGLTLVTALADHWDCVPYPPSGKTVRAVLSCPRAKSPRTPRSPLRSGSDVPLRATAIPGLPSRRDLGTAPITSVSGRPSLTD